uniref:synaptotagmin-5-like n=1 Tax=Fragaria vesca subsp. vesca TaxID=101020 RepID=UPI0005C911CE|nr:PREDICTED: synaptotagmin-5-like [Fragaria vesca subsp. vesca]XP_011457469.1 PREDICTED: synaptotagmin-5-like [Fragaria vesca subsp. vesca]XP_011457523.1 PREDICTED: synaptotagmin-5-like [Fragaria vesca subsp. vesca]XP_011457554.1 PREDICTED: synaptotagmin-5-like [Fragaria vesca subsp. vesca]
MGFARREEIEAAEFLCRPGGIGLAWRRLNPVTAGLTRKANLGVSTGAVGCGLTASDLELKPVVILEVKLVQTKELTNKDVVGKSDLFAFFYVRPLKDNEEKQNDHESAQHLVVKVFDDDWGIRLIGRALVQLSELQPGKVKDVWLKLVKSLEDKEIIKTVGSSLASDPPRLFQENYIWCQLWPSTRHIYVVWKSYIDVRKTRDTW